LINQALLKYGYANFSLEILEYCESSEAINREQYFLDLLKPEYNILKIAGSWLGHKHSPETIAKIKAWSITPEQRAKFLEHNKVQTSSKEHRERLLKYSMSKARKVEGGFIS
jgi:group I intron endonuclease